MLSAEVSKADQTLNVSTFIDMNTKRLEFALKEIKSDQWGRFERFASEFLQFDYPEIRSVAAYSGDLGRDSEIFSPNGDPTVLIQYSLRADWKAKIRETAARIRESFQDAAILIYATNQKIGANADDLKKEIRTKHKLILDIHDNSWFLDRASASEQREKASEAFIEDIVGEILRQHDDTRMGFPALPVTEAKTAALHLQLQWEDESRDKGLTKISFEAIVKSALNGTTSEKRMPANDVHKVVLGLLPHHPEDIVSNHFQSALNRLKKKGEVKHWAKDDELCLSFEECERIADSIADRGLREAALLDEIGAFVEVLIEPELMGGVDTIALRVRGVIDKFLLAKGEEFAAAVAEGRALTIDAELIDTIVTNDVAANDAKSVSAAVVNSIRVAAKEILQGSSEATQAYLRKISDGYTLLGFLRAVPDVQKSVQKVFGDGQIWLDTSAILPAIAETVLPPNRQIVSRLLRAAREAGISLKVTNGIVEEVERHINRCLAFTEVPAGQWVGGVPFLYALYSLQAKPREGFRKWTENIRGNHRPLDDVADYLADEWGIEVEDLLEEVEDAPQKLRWEVERIWREAHEARRKTMFVEYDEDVIRKLAKHDVECYLGVVGKRAKDQKESLGYRHWWLSLDKTVREFGRELEKSLGKDAPPVPVISPDFLADYIAYGPQRGRVSKATEAAMPVAFFDTLSDHIPAELIQIAEDLRREYGADCERVLRRKLRDNLDGMRARGGKIAAGGFAEIRERIEQEIQASTAK